MRLFRAFVTVSGFVVLSRILGFTRDILIARMLGAGPIADAFFVAFRFPNMFRGLFAEGAFNASFVPVFSGILETRGAEAARRFAEQMLALLLLALILFVIAVEAAMPAFIHVVAPGFADDPDKFETAVLYTRLTLPFLVFVALSALMSGVLNSLYRFAAAAGAPVVLNVALLFVLSLAWSSRVLAGEALAVAVTVGGIMQFVLLAIACRGAGMSMRLVRPRINPDVKRMLRLMLPAAIGAGGAQINLVVGTALASILGTGAISYLYYAERVNWLPVGVVGAALGTAVLPRLSRLLKSGDEAGAAWTQNRAIELLLLLGLPAAAAFLVVAEPIISVLFVRGAFTMADAEASARALSAFGLGLPAYLMVRILAPAFFAREDTATPVRVSFVGVAVNVTASLILMWPLGHVGIALGNVAAAWTNAGLLILILYRRGFLAIDARLKSRLPRIAVASAIMAAILWGVVPVLDPMLTGDRFDRFFGLAAIVIGGAGVYALGILALGAARIEDLRAALSKGPA